MKKAFILWILLFTGFLTKPVLSNEIFSRAPGYVPPVGSIAYMGSCYYPQRVHVTGLDDHFLIPKDNHLFANPFFTADKIQAVNERNQALEAVVFEMKLPVDPVEFNETYQTALLLHVLNPAKYGYNPSLTTFCGGRPYILITLVDFYAEFSTSINIRQKQKDQKIDYLGKRSIIERDWDMFRNKGRQGAVALELFLISTKDGSAVWQTNTITTAAVLDNNYTGMTKGLIGSAFKNMMKP